MGTYGINSEVLHLRRKFGSWQEDEASQKQRDLEFYEYVEAIRLTGDRNIPAGQVLFSSRTNHLLRSNTSWSGISCLKQIIF